MRRVVWWNSPEEKANWLDAYSTIDARHPFVRNMGVRLTRPFDPNDHGSKQRELQRFVRDSIQYIKDPRVEQFSHAAVVLRRGYGDCDDKAKLWTALARTVGEDVRIRPVFKGADFVHVQCEGRWPGSHLEPNAQDGGWLVVELILKGCELGQDIDDLPRGVGGVRLLS